MSEGMATFLRVLIAIVIYIGIGALVSWVFYFLKKKDLFGGYWGGLIVGVLGALVFGFVLDKFLLEIVIKVLEFLTYKTGVNIIFSLLGGWFTVWMMNKLNHNKERKKY